MSITISTSFTIVIFSERCLLSLDNSIFYINVAIMDGADVLTEALYEVLIILMIAAIFSTVRNFGSLIAVNVIISHLIF